LCGDLHRPLHVAAIRCDRECDEVVDPGIGSTVASTEGGNDSKLGGGSTSFHVFYWDVGTVTGARRLACVKRKCIKEFAQHIVNHPPAG